MREVNVQSQDIFDIGVLYKAIDLSIIGPSNHVSIKTTDTIEKNQ